MNGTYRERLIPVVGAAVLMFVVSPRLSFAVCGDGVPDPGEECDHGKTNGISCCDTACKWRPEGAGCIPAGGDACRQGFCDSQRFCIIPDAGYTDPCTGTTTCRGCVATGKSPASFSCTGPMSTDGTACADDAGPDHLCTVDACTDGECRHTSKECSAPDDPCLTSACNPKTGTCETRQSTAATCTTKSSRRGGRTERAPKRSHRASA